MLVCGAFKHFKLVLLFNVMLNTGTSMLEANGIA